MPDITGSIRTKKLGETGVTEDHLAADHKHPGTYRMAVCELVVEMPHGPDAEGNRKVDYRITMLEPVPEDQEEAVRSYLRTLYRLRPEQQGQAVLTGTAGDDEQSAADALATMEAGLPEAPEEPQEPAQAPGKAKAGKGPAADPFDASGDECPVADCTLPAFHDGDHQAAEETSGAPA